MTAAEDELRVRAERARAVALFRYQLVREAADPGLSTRQRGRLVRALADREHPGPFGTPVRVSRQSLDRWITAWRRGGFDALLPAPRQVTARTPVEVLDMAAALKRENPQRTAAQVVRILRTHLGWAPSESTALRLFARLELTGPAAAPASVFGRFEAGRPNERWTGDALPGPVVAGAKPTCSPSLMITVGRWWGTGSDMPRTPCGWPPRCVPPWPAGASRNRYMSITVPLLSTGGCCGPAPCWASS